MVDKGKKLKGVAPDLKEKLEEFEKSLAAQHELLRTVQPAQRSPGRPQQQPQDAAVAADESAAPDIELLLAGSLQPCADAEPVAPAAPQAELSMLVAFKAEPMEMSPLPVARPSVLTASALVATEPVAATRQATGSHRGAAQTITRESFETSLQDDDEDADKQMCSASSGGSDADEDFMECDD